MEGCCHGELDKIYETILKVEEREGIKIDLLICCGDFQVRWEGRRERCVERRERRLGMEGGEGCRYVFPVCRQCVMMLISTAWLCHRSTDR